MTPAIMIQGTCSNAGKSLLVAALCRIFAEDGFNPAPFKAQNMALNSFVTPDGREIGRAQALQAAACGRAPDTRMNPVLLKPSSDTGSQVLVMGRPVGHMRVQQYIAYKPTAWQAARDAYDSLAQEAGVMVIEGAGSPAEINLKSHDMVNMAVARHARAPVLLVADIDRGGAFAALVGTLALLDTDEQDMVAGLVLNKFRGDQSLLAPALDAITERTGKPFLGVVPWLPHLQLPEEDSVSFRLYGVNHGDDGAYPSAARPDCLDVALIDLPHMSNVTDVDALRGEPDVRLRLVSRVEDLGHPHLCIIPGSKNTPGDLRHLHESGLAEALVALARGPQAPFVVGICGGLQILGASMSDPHGLEGRAGTTLPGLNLLLLHTELAQEKTLRLCEATHESGHDLRGYEIHHGQTRCQESAPSTFPGSAQGNPLGAARPSVHDAEGRCLGWSSLNGRVFGTYLHGVLDADDFRRHLLNDVRQSLGWQSIDKPTPYTLAPGLERLAKAVRQSLDMDRVYALIEAQRKR